MNSSRHYTPIQSKDPDQLFAGADFVDYLEEKNQRNHIQDSSNKNYALVTENDKSEDFDPQQDNSRLENSKLNKAGSNFSKD